MGEYIFDEWKPESSLIVIGLILWSLSIYRADTISALLFTFAILFLGWGISFSRRKVKK